MKSFYLFLFVIVAIVFATTGDVFAFPIEAIGVMAAAAMIPSTERQRRLQPLDFAQNQVLSRDIPRDSVYKAFQFRLSGHVTTTFASGTPVADALSTFDNIIPLITIRIGGSRVVKAVRPYMLRIQQMLTAQILAERKSSAGASAATNDNPTVDAGFTYGTTGQITTVAETIYLPFEMVYASIEGGREKTWLNLKGASSAVIEMTCNSFSSLLGFGNTAPVVFSASTFKVDITTEEAQDVDPRTPFLDWKQTTATYSFSGEQTNYPIDLNKGNLITGVMILAREGQAGSSTTATGKLLSNNLIGSLSLKVNGQTEIKSTTFQQLQAENRARYGVQAPFASNVSLLDGVAHLNLLARKNIGTALDASIPATDSVQLFVNTSGSASYTNPATITLMTEELAVPY